jgi:hypothetical protein
MLGLPQPSYMPCPDCGASVAIAQRDLHVCDPERVVEFNMVKLRPEVEQFESELESYLNTPQGRFEAWYAEHRRAA